jgi:hypothetical protein
VQVFRYRRHPSDAAIRFPNSGFTIRKFIYDDVFLEMKHRRRARRALRKSIKNRQPTTS